MTCLCDYPLTKERWVEECIRPLMSTQVDTCSINLCSSDGYVCELKNGELLMDHFDSWPMPGCGATAENTKKLIAADANPPSSL